MEQKLIILQRSKNKQNRCTCKIKSAPTLSTCFLCRNFYKFCWMVLSHGVTGAGNSSFLLLFSALLADQHQVESSKSPDVDICSFLRVLSKMATMLGCSQMNCIYFLLYCLITPHKGFCSIFKHSSAAIM